MSRSSSMRSGTRKGRMVLAVTLGDAGGIGPEVALCAAQACARPGRLSLVLVGSRVAADAAARLRGLPAPPSWAPGDPPLPVALWEPVSLGAPAPAFGRSTAAAGKAAALWIEAAVDGCLTGCFDGLVTAPICKAGFEKARIPYPGHTEMLAALTGAARVAMLLVGGPLRVVLATRHLPLARVAEAVTPDAIRDAVELVAAGLPWMGLSGGRIAVCGLNPHAGDGGLLGGEERAVIGPTVRRLRRAGFPVEGPVPADVVFFHAARRRYAAVVAMYHDQGLAPLKMAAFDRGVNVTLGLPIVRTSPDHGVAYDIAGQGRADPGSMREAIRLAARLARRPNPWLRFRRRP